MYNRFQTWQATLWVVALLEFAAPATLAQAPWAAEIKSRHYSALVLDLDFSDAVGSIFDPQELHDSWRDVGTFWNDSSYGAITMAPRVTSVLRMPETMRTYEQGIASGSMSIFHLMTDALQLASATGYVLEDYDFHILMAAPALMPTVGVGAPGHKVWCSATRFGLMAHELTHSLNSGHSNAWKTRTLGSIIGPGNVVPYGNVFDVLGSVHYEERSHPNTRLKNRLGWLPDSHVQTVTSSGVYWIQAHDRPLSTLPAALRIKRDEDTNYWVEFRDLLYENHSVSNGALVHWGFNSWHYFGAPHVQQSLLLDMTPLTHGNFEDAALAPGTLFRDAAAGIEIAVIGKGGTIPESLGLVVTLAGTPTPIDQPVEVTIEEPRGTTTILTGSTTFEAWAHDPDAGTQGGDGMAGVEFRLFAGGSETPIATHGPVTTFPYTWTLDTNSLPDGGYVLIAAGTSLPNFGGHLTSEGTFFMVHNN